MKNKFLSIVMIGALAIAAAAVTAGAGELKGVEFPDEIQVDGTKLVLNGLGLRQATAMKVSVYVAGLYVTEKSGDPRAILASQTPKKLVLHFMRSVGGSDLTQAWDDGFDQNVPDQVAALKPRIEKIKSFTPDMKKGQELVFTYRPGTGITVDVDGRVTGTVEGDDFAKAFLSIWLGPNPPNKILKDGILGGA